MRHLFKPILDGLHGKDPGLMGALAGLAIALLWVIFGFLKMLFILVVTLIGYIVGARYFRNSDNFRDMIDRFLPPGRFR